MAGEREAGADEHEEARADGAERLPPRERAGLAQRLREALGAEAVLEGEACAPYAVQGCVPGVVARPEGLVGVSSALAAASAAGARVLPWSGGTRQGIGYPPARCDLVVSVERLTRVLTYDPADLTISVEAGLTHAALARVLAEHGQMLPLDVPLPKRATLAGTLACGTPGLRRATLGAPRDLTLGLRVVSVDGTLLTTGGRVVKNVTGYDMTKLFLGSFGTLGILAEANLKLVPLPEREVTLVAVTAAAPQALAAAETLSPLALRPTALALSSAWAFPQLASFATRGADQALLAVRLAGSAAAVERAEREARMLLAAETTLPLVTLTGASVAEFWQAAADVAISSEAGPTFSRRALLRVSTMPSRVLEVIDEARAWAEGGGFRCAWLADLLAGTVWLTVDLAAGDGGGAQGDVAAALGGLQARLLGLGGQCVVLACPPGLKRRLPIWGKPPAGLALMREVKRRFDPADRLNPGRFLPGIGPELPEAPETTLQSGSATDTQER